MDCSVRVSHCISRAHSRIRFGGGGRATSFEPLRTRHGSAPHGDQIQETLISFKYVPNTASLFSWLKSKI